jgi:hypothetical protein
VYHNRDAPKIVPRHGKIARLGTCHTLLPHP